MDDERRRQRPFTPITSGPFDDREPHWSPDAREIAFVCAKAKGGDIRPGGDGWVGGQGRITLILSPPEPC